MFNVDILGFSLSCCRLGSDMAEIPEIKNSTSSTKFVFLELSVSKDGGPGLIFIEA